MQLKRTARAADTLAVSAPRDCCWMWSTPGERPVLLEVQLERL